MDSIMMTIIYVNNLPFLETKSDGIFLATLEGRIFGQYRRTDKGRLPIKIVFK